MSSEKKHKPHLSTTRGKNLPENARRIRFEDGKGHARPLRVTTRRPLSCEPLTTSSPAGAAGTTSCVRLPPWLTRAHGRSTSTEPAPGRTRGRCASMRSEGTGARDRGFPAIYRGVTGPGTGFASLGISLDRPTVGARTAKRRSISGVFPETTGPSAALRPLQNAGVLTGPVGASPPTLRHRRLDRPQVRRFTGGFPAIHRDLTPSLLRLFACATCLTGQALTPCPRCRDRRA